MTYTLKHLYELGLGAHTKSNRYFTAKYGFGFDDESVRKATEKPCHGDMMGWDGYNGKKPIVINNVLNRGTLDNEANRTFYEYLVKRSPFKDCYVNKDVDRFEAEGVMVRLDVGAANKSVSASIATRHPWEHRDLIETFCKLTEWGLNEDKALLAATCVGVMRDDTTYYNRYKSNHIFFEVHSLTKSGVKNFLNHEKGHYSDESTVIGNRLPYCEALTYGRLASYWNDEGRNRGYVRTQPPLQFNGGGVNPYNHDSKDPFRILPLISKPKTDTKKKHVVEQIEEVFEKALA